MLECVVLSSYTIVCCVLTLYIQCLGSTLFVRAFFVFLGFFMTDMYVVIFVVLFSAFCLLCCAGRFRVFVTLFTILPLYLSLYIQFLGQTSDQYVLFVFFSFVPPPDLMVFFFLLVSPPRHTCEIWSIRDHMDTPMPTSRVPPHQIVPLHPSKPLTDICVLPVLCV